MTQKVSPQTQYKTRTNLRNYSITMVIIIICSTVPEAPAAPGIRGGGQQPVAPCRQRRQTGRISGLGPSHGTVDACAAGNAPLCYCHVTKNNV